MFPRLYVALAALVGLATAQSTVNTITNTFTGANGIVTVPWPPTCGPVLNTQTTAVYDSNAQELYYYMCGAATANGANGLATIAAPNSWRDCFAICDNTAGCTSFSYNNGPNFGEGAGQCVLKNAIPPAFSQTDALQSTRVAVIRYRFVNTATGGAAVVTTTTTTTSSSSGGAFPTTTTSTTTTTTTSQSGGTVTATATATATTLSTVVVQTTVVSTQTATIVSTATATLSVTGTVTGTATVVSTATATATATQSVTGTVTGTATVVSTATATATATATQTQSVTGTVTGTATATATATSISVSVSVSDRVVTQTQTQTTIVGVARRRLKRMHQLLEFVFPIANNHLILLFIFFILILLLILILIRIRNRNRIRIRRLLLPLLIIIRLRRRLLLFFFFFFSVIVIVVVFIFHVSFFEFLLAFFFHVDCAECHLFIINTELHFIVKPNFLKQQLFELSGTVEHFQLNAVQYDQFQQHASFFVIFFIKRRCDQHRVKHQQLHQLNL
ncbi:Hypothetical protein D9617_1g085740 [Elsinoe fawcettii]|nr:Hypothetical protein D9617_1g085740 [Elsinoe fawcettii]